MLYIRKGKKKNTKLMYRFEGGGVGKNRVQAPLEQARGNSGEEKLPWVRKKPREEPGSRAEPNLLRSNPDETRKTELTGGGA